MAVKEPAVKKRKTKETTKTIKFKLKPAANLKNSLDSLRDNDFNPLHIVKVEVNDTGFYMMYRNGKTSVHAALFFKRCMLIDFRCTRPLVPHFMFLDQIVFDFLNDVPDDETITIFHIGGSDQPQLSFKFKSGCAPANILNVGLMKVFNAAAFQKSPYGSPLCWALLNDRALNDIFNFLERKPHKRVSVEVKNGVMLISGEVPELSIFGAIGELKSDFIRTRRGMKHHARFKLPHLEAIRKATSVNPDAACAIRFLRQPDNRVMMVFLFARHGGLVFLLKAEMLDTTPDVDSHSGDASKASQPGLDAVAAKASQPDGDAAKASLSDG